MRSINEAGLQLIKDFEKRRLVAYQDIGGIWTCGWGSTGPDIVKGTTWSPDEADQRLANDLQKFYELDHFVSEQVNDNQYSALICLAYNVGLTAVKNSRTLKCVNGGASPDQEWLGFDKVNGQVVQGLINRRKAELELYHKLG
jgi:lysozyme